MNATAAAAARTLPVARPLVQPALRRDSAEPGVRPCYLTTRLIDAIIGSFSLTEYEQQVVNHLIQGRSCKAIAARLGIRETTVHKHMHRIYAKTKTDSRQALYNLALRLSAHRSIGGGGFRRVAAAA